VASPVPFVLTRPDIHWIQFHLFYRRQELPEAEKCRKKGKAVSWFGFLANLINS